MIQIKYATAVAPTSSSSESIPHFIFLSDYAHRQGCADTEEYEGRPFLAEGVDDNGEYEPVEQLAVCEKAECATDNPMLALTSIPYGGIKFKREESGLEYGEGVLAYPGVLDLILRVISIHFFIQYSCDRASGSTRYMSKKHV